MSFNYHFASVSLYFIHGIVGILVQRGEDMMETPRTIPRGFLREIMLVVGLLGLGGIIRGNRRRISGLISTGTSDIERKGEEQGWRCL